MNLNERQGVVPLVGTWIETGFFHGNAYPLVVVPLVGTWIETPILAASQAALICRSPRGNVD